MQNGQVKNFSVYSAHTMPQGLTMLYYFSTQPGAPDGAELWPKSREEQEPLEHLFNDLQRCLAYLTVKYGVEFFREKYVKVKQKMNNICI